MFVLSGCKKVDGYVTNIIIFIIMVCINFQVRA